MTSVAWFALGEGIGLAVVVVLAVAYIALGAVALGIVSFVAAVVYVALGARHMAEVDEGDAFGGEYE